MNRGDSCRIDRICATMSADNVNQQQCNADSSTTDNDLTCEANN